MPRTSKSKQSKTKKTKTNKSSLAPLTFPKGSSFKDVLAACVKGKDNKSKT